MAADSDGNVIDNDTGDSITTIVTCEGDYFDPKFHEEFKVTLDRLECLLCDSEKLKTDERGKRNEDCNFDCVDDSSSDSEVPDKPSDDDGGDRKNKLKVAKLEPWNSVRVTLAIPREAAARLRQLAAEGSAQLRQLGILSVQIEGDQVISLRIASRFGNEDQTQEIVLNTTGSVQNGSDINATPGTSGLNAQAASGITRLLQSAASASTGVVCNDQVAPGPIPVTPAATSANGIEAGGVQESKVPFRSPNVICPTDTQVPRVAAGTATSSGSGSTSRSHYNGPFPFASMQQAAQAIQSRAASGLDPHHGAGPLNINAAAAAANNRLVVGSSANNSASQQMVSGTSGPVSYAQPPPPYPSTVQTAVQKTSVQPNQPNIAITSPLLVNLLQTDGSPQGTCGAPVAPKPVPPNIAGPGARKGIVKQQPPLSRIGSELSECPGDNDNAAGVNGNSNNLLSGPQSAFAVVSGSQTPGLKLPNQTTSTPQQLVPQLSSSVPSNIASTLPQQNVIRTAANNLNIANPRLMQNHYGVPQQRVLVAQRPNPQNMPAPSLVPQQVPHQAAMVKQNVGPMLPGQKTPVNINHKGVFMNRPEIGQLDQTGYRQGPPLPVGQSPFPVGQQPSNFTAVANSATTSTPGFPGAPAPPPYPVSNRTTGFQQDFQQKLLQQQSQNRLWGGQYNASNDNMMPIGQPMPSNVPQYAPNQSMQPIAQPMPQISVPNNLNLDGGLSHITPSLTDLSKTDLDSLLPSLDMDEAVDLLNSDLGVPLPEPEPIVEPEPQLTSKGKRRLFLINPLSGVLEPMPSDSSDSESETDAKNKDKEMDVFSELNDKSSLFSDDEDTSSTTNSRSKANHDNDQSDSDATIKSAASDTGAKRSKNVKSRERNRSPALVKTKFSNVDKNKTDVGKMKNLIDGKIKNIDKINKSLESYNKISKSAESATLKSKEGLKCKGVSCESTMSKVRNQALNKLGSGGLLMSKETPTEKIKLRLKLEKSEPVNPAYKVDVSFVNLQEPKKAATNASAAAMKSNSDIGSSSSAATHLPSTVQNSSPGEELRVPPLHISLRGRNSVVISNKSKKYKNSDDITSISDGEKQIGAFKKSKIRNKDKDINCGSASSGLKIKNKTLNKDAVKNSLVSTNSFVNKMDSSDSVSNSDDDSSSNDTLLNYKSAMSSTKPTIVNKTPMLKSLTNKKVLDDDELPLGYKREPGEIVMPSLKSFGNDSNKKLSKKINKLSETYREQNLLSGGHTLYSATDKSHKKLKIDADAFKTKSRHDQEIIKAGVKRQHSDSLVNGILRESPDTKKRRLSQPSLDGFPDSSVSGISSSLKSKPATIGSSNVPTMTTSSGSPIVKQNASVLSGSIGSTNVGTVPPYKTMSHKSVGLKSNSLALKSKRDKERAGGTKSKDDRPSTSSPKSKDINRDKTYSKIVAEKRQQQNNEALKATTGLLSLPTAGELDMEAKFKQRLMENSDMSYNPKHHKPGDGSGGFSDTSTTKRFSSIIGGKTSHVVLNRITTELDHRYHSIRMDGKKAGGKLVNSSDNLKMTKNSLENKNSMKKINDSRQTDSLPGIQNNGKYGGKMSEKDSISIQRKMSREENLNKAHEDSKSNEQKSADKMESRLCFEENSDGIIKRSESEEHVLRIMGDRNSLLLKSSNAETGLGKKERLDEGNVILRDSDANTIAQILRSSTNPISKQCQDLQNLAASTTDIDILKQAAGRSPPTSNTGQGEDSGIESMDASSEKSPLQSGQSPHCHTDLTMNDPTVKSISDGLTVCKDSLVVVADYNKRSDDAYRLTGKTKNCGVESNTNEKIISSLVKDLSSGESTSLENEIIKDNLLASNANNSETNQRLQKGKSDYEIGDIEAELAKMEGLTGGNGDSDSYGQKSQVSLDSVYSFTESDCDIKESLRHNNTNAKSESKCKIEIKNEVTEENCIKNESNYYAGDESLTVFKKDKDVNENKRDKTMTVIKEEINRNDDFGEHKQKLKLNNHAVNPVAEKLCEAKIKNETEQNFLDKSEKSNSRQKQENQNKLDQKRLDNIVGTESNKDDTKNDLDAKNDTLKCSENIDASLENCVIDDFDPLPIRRTPPLYTYSNPEKQMRDNNDSPLLRGLSDLEDSDNSENDRSNSEDESADMKMNSSSISEKSVTQTRSRKDRNILCSTDSTASDDNYFTGDLKIDKKMHMTNVGQKSLLEQLLIEIPGDNSDKSMSSLSHSPAVSDKNFPKSNVRTRASSKLNSPDANPDSSRMNLRTPKHSPVILKGDSRANSPAQTGCKNSPKVVATAGKVATVKRKRRESESSTQSTQSVEDAAQTRNKKTRKCSENAAGLIKACMGVDGENTANKSNAAAQPNVKTAVPIAGQKAPVTNASASKSAIKTTIKNNVVAQRKQNPLDIESSDSDEPLIEIAGKQKVSVTKTIMATRNSKLNNSTVTGKGVSVAPAAAQNQANKNIVGVVKEEQKLIGTRRSIRSNAGININLGKLKTRNNKTGSAATLAPVNEKAVGSVGVQDGDNTANVRRKTRSAVSEATQQDNAASAINKRTRRNSKDGK